MSSPESDKFEVSRRAIGRLWVYAVVSVLAAPVPFINDALAPFAAGVTGIFQILAILGFIVWFREAYAKLALLGYPSRYTPGMALAVFFVPFSRLFRAGEVVGELYAGSDPTRLRPETKRRIPRPRAAAIWWYGFIASSVAGDLAAAMMLRASTRTPRVIVLTVVSQLLGAVAAAGAAHFIADIRQLQKHCAALMRLDRKSVQSRAVEDEGFRASGGLTTTLLALLFAAGAARLALGALGLLGLLYEENTTLARAAMGMIALDAALTLVILVVFLCWVHRVARNMRRSSALSTSPAMAVLGFFIPIYNILHVRDLFHAMWRWTPKRRTAPAKPPAGAAVIDFWWLTVLLQVALVGLLVGFSLNPQSGLPPWVFRAGSFTLLGLSLATIAMLRHIVSTIGVRVSAMEKVLIAERALETPPPAPPAAAAAAPARATWTEVLLPIASAVAEAVEHEDPAVREQRARAERARDAQRLALKRSTFHSAAPNTRTARVLLLLAIFVGLAETMSYVVRMSPFLILDVIVIVFGAAICGLPPWIALWRWAYAESRNAISVGRLSGDPAATARRMLLFGEPRVFEALLRASSSTASPGVFQVWKVTLRALQLAPLWLAMASVGTDVVRALAGLVFLACLVVCLSLTATMMRDIDTRLAALHGQGAAVPEQAASLAVI